MTQLPDTMTAAAIDQFGGPQAISAHRLPVPHPDSGELLVRVHTADVGVWDPAEREGRMTGDEVSFPLVLGADGSGVVASVGDDVDLFEEGDRVYGSAFLSAKGGFYAEYAVVAEEQTAAVPHGLGLTEAGVLSIDGVTALRGLRDVLELKEGEGILIFGASGGVGHLAVQLALIMGARVLAVASGGDGVKMVEGLGAHVVVDGHATEAQREIEDAVADIAPNGLDAALVTAHADSLDVALDGLRPGARMAWPTGVSPEPRVPSEVSGSAYSGRPDREILDTLNQLVESGPFTVHVHEAFSLGDASTAHRALEKHYLGKLALRISGPLSEESSRHPAQ